MSDLLLPRRCPECNGSCYTAKIGEITRNTSKWQCKDCHTVFYMGSSVSNFKLMKTSEKPFIDFN